MCFFFFFFQAEDGIRDRDVTGVQTCALPSAEGFIPPSARKATEFGVGPKAIATRKHREGSYRRFPAWILT